MQLPMAVFTTLAPMASGAFIGLALAFFTTRFTQDQLLRIDRWTLLPLLVLAAGYVASFVFFASPQHAVGALQGIRLASVSVVALVGMLFVSLAVVYWIIAMAGGLPYRARKAFAAGVGAVALVLSFSIGALYMTSSVVAWNSPFVPLGMMGFCAAAGVPLGVLVVALAGGLPQARATRFPAAAMIAAFVGVLVALLSVFAQLLFAQSVYSAFSFGEQMLPSPWVHLVVFVTGLVAMLWCLRSALLPGKLASTTPLGRQVHAAAVSAHVSAEASGRAEAGRRMPVGSAVLLVAAGSVLAAVAVFAARLLFYALQV